MQHALARPDSRFLCCTHVYFLCDILWSEVQSHSDDRPTLYACNWSAFCSCTRSGSPYRQCYAFIMISQYIDVASGINYQLVSMATKPCNYCLKPSSHYCQYCIVFTGRHYSSNRGASIYLSMGMNGSLCCCAGNIRRVQSVDCILQYFAIVILLSF